MILKSIAILSVLMASAAAFGANYDCQVLKVDQNATLIGTMKLDTETSQAQKVVLNQNQDFCACLGLPKDQAGIGYLGCLFSEGGSEIKFRKLGNGKVLALKKDKRTGQISSVHFAMSDTGVSQFMQALPSNDMSKVFVVACAKTSQRR